MPSLAEAPNWYVVIAVVVSLYQGYRGFAFQWIPANKENRLRVIVLLCLADTLLYLISTLAGFVSLFLAYFMANKITAFGEIQVGTSLLLMFLALFGIFGTTGQLPHLIQQGKLPWPTGSSGK